MDDCELAALQNPEDWQAYHDLRRRVLFEARGRFGVYDPDHPDEHRERHHPLLLRYDGEPVGTVRIDQKNQEQAVIRLVVIREDLQGRGHGRGLIECAERFIQDLGCRSALVNAAPTARDFYRRLGFVEQAWDATDGRPESVQMVKQLA